MAKMLLVLAVTEDFTKELNISYIETGRLSDNVTDHQGRILFHEKPPNDLIYGRNNMFIPHVSSVES